MRSHLNPMCCRVHFKLSSDCAKTYFFYRLPHITYYEPWFIFSHLIQLQFHYFSFVSITKHASVSTHTHMQYSTKLKKKRGSDVSVNKLLSSGFSFCKMICALVHTQWLLGQIFWKTKAIWWNIRLCRVSGIGTNSRQCKLESLIHN